MILRMSKGQSASKKQANTFNTQPEQFSLSCER
jgi:hypothetical protein